MSLQSCNPAFWVKLQDLNCTEWSKDHAPSPQLSPSPAMRFLSGGLCTVLPPHQSSFLPPLGNAMRSECQLSPAPPKESEWAGGPRPAPGLRRHAASTCWRKREAFPWVHLSPVQIHKWQCKQEGDEFLQISAMELPCDPAVPLLGRYENDRKQGLNRRLHVRAHSGFFTGAKRWKQPRCPSTGE